MKWQWFSRLSIQQKLFISLGWGFAGFVIYFAVTFTISKNNQELLNGLVDRQLPMLETVETLGNGLDTVKAALAQGAGSGGTEVIGQLEQAHGEIILSFKKLRANGAGRIKDLDDAEKRYIAAGTGGLELLRSLMAGSEKVSTVQGRLQEYTRELGQLQRWCANLQDSGSDQFRASVDAANAGIRRAMYAGWVLLLALAPFAFLLFYVTRGVSQGLQSVSERLSEVSQNMLQISNQASASSTQLAASSNQQATAVSQSMSSMDEMKSKLGLTVQHSGEALRSSEESFREASDGRFVLESMRAAIMEIKHSYEQLEEVNQVVRLIGDKTNVINDIVFKTQLLSFNASIEAARAGQHGRGFAVVASEVGKLAEMSGRAAQEIAKLIDHSTKKVAEIVGGTRGKVDSANDMSQECAKVFQRITERAGQVKSMVNSITDAATEQESGIVQVGHTMADLSHSADEADKMAHMIAELSEVLIGHSKALASTVDRLDSLVQGRKSA